MWYIIAASSDFIVLSINNNRMITKNNYSSSIWLCLLIRLLSHHIITNKTCWKCENYWKITFQMFCCIMKNCNKSQTYDSEEIESRWKFKMESKFSSSWPHATFYIICLLKSVVLAIDNLSFFFFVIHHDHII